MLEEQDTRTLRGFNWLRFTVAGFYEYGNEIWSSVKAGII
jgi:hypothetical protein